MKILIIEGIATSGKSTITDSLKRQLPNLTIRVATEAETHIPIMELTTELHITFFEDLINRLVALQPELIILDRLYMTQAFRAGVSLSRYSDLEDILSKIGSLTVFLKIDETAVAERVKKAAEHRDSSWGEYIKTKGATDDEIADYYITQQRNQMKLLETSTLPYMVCDTTNHNYDQIAQNILKELHLNKKGSV